MNFIAQVEEHLRDLGSEARKKHPGVKEASERAILTLRSLQTRYISAVRAARQPEPVPSEEDPNDETPRTKNTTRRKKNRHPTTALFRSQDVLRPFLLACNYPDAGPEIVEICLRAMQLLMSGDAVCPDDSVQIARVLVLQALRCTVGGGTGGGGSVSGNESTTSFFRSVMGSGASTLTSSSASSVSSTTSQPSPHHPMHHRQEHRHHGTSTSSSTAASTSTISSSSTKGEEDGIPLRVLQTLTVMVSSPELDLGEETLRQALQVCTVLLRPTSEVRRAAAATLRQTLTVVCDRSSLSSASSSLISSSSSEAQPDQRCRNAIARAFTDLCTLALPSEAVSNVTDQSKQGTTQPDDGQSKHPTLPRRRRRRVLQGPLSQGACMELLDMILSHRPELFRLDDAADREADPTLWNDDDDFGERVSLLLKHWACPMVTECLATKAESDMDESLSRRPRRRRLRSSPLEYEQRRRRRALCHWTRSVRLASTIIRNFGRYDQLTEECRGFWTVLVRPVVRTTETFRDAVDGRSPGRIISGGEDELSSSPSVNVPDGLLWKSALALETIYHVIVDDPELLVLDDDNNDGKQRRPDAVAVVVEAVADFGTVVSRDSAALAAAASATLTEHQDSRDEDLPYRYRPDMYARARTWYEEWESRDDGSSSTETSTHSTTDDTEGAVVEIPPCDAGEALRMAFFCILALLRGIHNDDDDDDIVDSKDENGRHKRQQCHRRMVEATFGPSLSTLQHVLKGLQQLQPSIVGDGRRRSLQSLALEGYVNLARLCFKTQPLSASQTVDDNDDDTALRHVRTEALLRSLCKLCYSPVSSSSLSSPHPQTDSRLQHHDGASYIVETLGTLFEILHRYHSFIRETSHWTIVLSTLERLSQQRRQKHRSDNYMDNAVAAAFDNFTTFTTCLPQEILSKFVEALINLSKRSCLPENLSDLRRTVRHEEDNGDYNKEVNGDENVLPSTLPPPLAAQQHHQSSSQTIGGKLMSLAGRAFSSTTPEYVRNHTETDSLSSSSSSLPTMTMDGVGAMRASSRPSNDRLALENDTIPGSNYDRGKNNLASATNNPKASGDTYGRNLYSSAHSRLAPTKPTTRKEAFHTLPFSLVVLTDVGLKNSFRLHVMVGSLTEHLYELATSSSLTSSTTSQQEVIRPFAMDALTAILSSQLGGSGASRGRRTRIKELTTTLSLPRLYLAVDNVEVSLSQDNDGFEGQIEAESLFDPFAPLCRAIADTPSVDAAEAGLNSLHVILESSGHCLGGNVWPDILSTVAALSGGSNMDHPNHTNHNENTDKWSACGTLAFRCLKLVVDDFLDDVLAFTRSVEEKTKTTTSVTDICQVDAREALLHCCASFGRSRFDVNTSLTATGMLWTIADRDPSPKALEQVLSQLATLACDERPEVRNCSVNTLFSCVVGLGDRFTSDQWKACLGKTIFGVLDKIHKQIGNTLQPQTSNVSTLSSSNTSRYRMTVHHSRDSVSKQWCATQVLTMRGLERVLKQFFSRLVLVTVLSSPSTTGDEDGRWFGDVWERILTMAHASATDDGSSHGREARSRDRDTLDLRCVGVDVLATCTQLSCRSGMLASSSNQVRVGTNMQVVDGALRNVGSKATNTSSNSNSYYSSKQLNNVLSEAQRRRIEERKSSLFSGAFNALEKAIRNISNVETGAENGETTSTGNTSTRNAMFDEASHLQVLHRISLGLTQIYECCKAEELAPAPSVSNESNATVDTEEQQHIERRMVNMVHQLAIQSGNKSRYLTQAERACLDLLTDMCGGGSAYAFEQLAKMGSKSFYCISASLDDNMDSDGPIPDFELLEVEAGKKVAQTFLKAGVSSTAKINVLSMILKEILERLQTQNGDESIVQTQSNSYDLLRHAVQGGLEAAALLKKETSEERSHYNGNKGEQEEMLWQRMMSVISHIVLGAIINYGDATLNLSKKQLDQIIEILSTCCLFVPECYKQILGSVLAEGTSNALKVAQTLYEQRRPPQRPQQGRRRSSEKENKEGGEEEDGDGLNDVLERVSDVLRLFDGCLVGLCRCDPTNDTLFTIAETSLKDILGESSASTSLSSSRGSTDTKKRYTSRPIQRDGSRRPSVEFEADDEDAFRIEKEIGLIVCEAIRSGGSAMGELIIRLFPWLCKLTNANDERLRRKCGAVLGSVDLIGIVGKVQMRAETAEHEIKKLEGQNETLRDELNAMKLENEGLKKEIQQLSSESPIR